jgi:hypothetical protein
MAVLPLDPWGRMPAKLERAIAWAARHQHGLVSRDHLLGLGLGEDAIDYRIGVGLLEVVHPSVYRVAGAPEFWEQSLLAAQLGAGPDGAISHTAAGAVLELEGVTADRPHVLLPHERKVKLVGVRVHRTRVLPDRDVTTRQGLRITSVARTLVDLAGVLSAPVLERALDDALRRRIVTLGQLRRTLDSRGPNGVRGWGRLDAFVEERRGTKPTGSGKETTFRRGLITRGLPKPIPQFTITDDVGRFVARVDFAYPAIKLAIEVDGSQHADLAQWRADLERQNRLTIVRWHFLRFPRTDRKGQLEAFRTIEAALSAFGEA